MKCSTIGCPGEVMAGESWCPTCVLAFEVAMGRAGFAPHGRDPSQRYLDAVTELERRQKERITNGS